MDLRPNNSYLLKWSSVKPNGQINNMIILIGEFIKYFNNAYCEDYMRFVDSDEDPPAESLLDTIVTQEGEVIELITYPFDNPLYPYGHITQLSSCNFGLFRITGIRQSIFKGIEQPFRNNNPYNFATLKEGSFIDTPRINYGETLG